jgi:OPT family oligopeptide transporter
MQSGYSAKSEDPCQEKLSEDSTAAGEVMLDPRTKMSEEYWFENVYQGKHAPQLTVRAVLIGGLLGSLMSISNLYTSIKVGWAFGVAITACVLSYTFWGGLRLINRNLSPMTILENNCMQSTASAAGYSTGATIGTAFGALLLITGKHASWPILLLWTLVTAGLGVFLAVPLKRKMINHEQLPFPSGIAAAETLHSLYGRSQAALAQARALVSSLVVGVVIGFMGKGEFAWQSAIGLKLPELIAFHCRIVGVNLSLMPGFGFEPSVLLPAAGMIVGLRVCCSMIFGSVLLYFVVGPYVIHAGEVQNPAKLIRLWSLWTGTAILVTSGLTAFALQFKRKSLGKAPTEKEPAEKTDESKEEANAVKGTVSRQEDEKDRRAAHVRQESREEIEVPKRWLFLGLVPFGLAMIALQYVAFSISPLHGLISIVMSFFLALVACRATGETDITPIGAMGKISQLTYAVLMPQNITANLMAGSVTANIASSSADLLTDLKSGYLLGANPRKQFIAQFIGIFFGTAAIVPAWYLMIPNKAILENYNPPSANMWRAVAEALANGIDFIPPLARAGMVVGGMLGIILVLIDYYAPPKIKPYLPSPMGLGLSWVFPFANSFSFFIGAVFSALWCKLAKHSADTFTIPVASGAIAGESLICAFLAMYNAANAIGR